MTFKISSMALVAALGLAAGATSVHAQSTTPAASTPAAGTPAPTASVAKPAPTASVDKPKPMPKKTMKPMHMARAHAYTNTSASAQDAAVEKLNEQSLSAAQAGKTPSISGGSMMK